jgi:hypothetical protein
MLDGGVDFMLGLGGAAFGCPVVVTFGVTVSASFSSIRMI